MRDATIVGAGLTRFGKFPDATLRTMAHEAIAAALADAGILPHDVQAVFSGNAIAGLMTGQEMVRGQVVTRSIGLSGIPVVNVENACASGSTAVHLASTAVASGQYDLVLAFGAEKMTHPDKRRAALAVATALDLEEGFDESSASPFMDVYAAKVRTYLQNSEATVEDLGRVVVKAQRNGLLNPFAQYGGHVSFEQVLADPVISDPLTRMMCSPIGDGAAAVVVASRAVARRLGITSPVTIRASVLRSGSDPGSGDPAGCRAARAAYEEAGIGPHDLDVVELHDAAAPAELIRYESLQLAPRGEGCRLIRQGITELGGELPVNPSGGLLARGHPIAATGCAQIAELYRQLRGRAGDHQVEDARVGLADNGGGWVRGDSAAECVHILVAD
jgi:acetyl-CoA acyltransferase